MKNTNVNYEPHRAPLAQNGGDIPPPPPLTQPVQRTTLEPRLNSEQSIPAKEDTAQLCTVSASDSMPDATRNEVVAGRAGKRPSNGKRRARESNSENETETNLFIKIKEFVLKLFEKDSHETKTDLKELQRDNQSLRERIRELEQQSKQDQRAIGEFRESLHRLQQKVDSIELRISAHDNRINNLGGVIQDCSIKVVALKQNHVMAAAERRDEYHRFVRDFIALVDLVDEKMKQHRAKTLLDDFSRKLFGVMAGDIDFAEFLTYIDNMVLPTSANGECSTSLDAWGKTKKEIREFAVGLKDKISHVDSFAKDFDHKERFVETLILPSQGEPFDSTRMESRQVEPGDDELYAVASVQRIGMIRTSANQELKKSLVSVSQTTYPNRLPQSDINCLPN